MPSIRVRFVANKRGFVGRAIRFVTDSLFQHVEFGTPEGTWIGAHAGDGVQNRADYAYDREYVYEIPCTQEQQDQLLKWARAQIGTQYNYLDILGLLLRKRFWTTPNRFICSQFVCQGLLDVFGAHRVLNVLACYAYRITPQTLHLSPIFVGHLVRKKE